MASVPGSGTPVTAAPPAHAVASAGVPGEQVPALPHTATCATAHETEVTVWPVMLLTHDCEFWVLSMTDAALAHVPLFFTMSNERLVTAWLYPFSPSMTRLYVPAPL